MRYPLSALLGVVLSSAVRPDTKMTTPPEVLVEEIADEIIRALQQHQQQPDSSGKLFVQLLDDILAPYLDSYKAARLALGEHWHACEANQQQQFEQAFLQSLLHYYAQATLEYIKQCPVTDDLIEIAPATVPANERDIIVKTRLHCDTTPALEIDYTLHNSHGHWKIYDISVDGISLVLAHRQEFSHTMQTTGLAGLISKLARHNQNYALQPT